MTGRNKSTNLLFAVLSAIIVIAGVAFWLSDLTSDPPLYYSGQGQSLSTDPPQYVHHARNHELFGEFDPFDYPRWTVYQHSLTSALAIVWFSVAGVSLGNAHLVGLFLSMGAMMFFVLGLWRHHRPWVVATFVLCYLINVTLLTYGRHPYLENGLIFIGSIMFFVYSRWGHRASGAILCGALAACAGLVGKLFGFLLLPALLLTYFFTVEHDRWKYITQAVAGFVACAVILTLALYGTDFVAAMGYVGEQSYGLRGFPEGLSSPWGFVEKLIQYGHANRMFYLTPDIFMFYLVAMGLTVLVVRKRADLRALSPTVCFGLFWVITAVIGLMPLNYSPLRYALLFMPVVIILVFALLDDLSRAKPYRVNNLSWLSFLGLLYVGWVMFFHIGANLFYFNVPAFPYRMMTWVTLPAGILFALACKFYLHRRSLTLTPRLLVVVILLCVGASILTNSFRIRRLHIIDHSFNILEANADLAEILGPDAVLSGPYAPTLTIDNDLRCFIHLFGVASVDSTLFDRYPITHLAVDISNWGVAKKDYPQLEPLPAVATYYIRDVEIKIFNISKVFANETAHAYQETGYEKAVSLMHTGKLDEAFQIAGAFYHAHPQSKSAGYIFGDLLMRHGDAQQAYSVMASMAERYPTDFFVQINFAKLLQMMAVMKQDQALLNMAKQYYERGVKANRFRGGYASQQFEQIMRQSTQPGR